MSEPSVTVEVAIISHSNVAWTVVVRANGEDVRRFGPFNDEPYASELAHKLADACNKIEGTLK